MMLTRLKACAAAVALGVIAAGAVVSAQPPGGGRGEQAPPAPATPRPARTIPGKGGNLIVDWIPAGGQGGKTKEVTVDPTRHCMYLSMTSLKAEDRPNDGVLRVDLEHGKTYTVTASGEAFMTAQTGVDADPYPGVVLYYGTDEEDCYAFRQTVLAPGKSITFRAPWNIQPKADVYLMAFFLDYSPQDPKRGSYTLTITESGETALGEHTIKAELHEFSVTPKGDNSRASRLYRALVDQANMELQKEGGLIFRPRPSNLEDPAAPARRDAKARKQPGDGGDAKDAPK